MKKCNICGGNYSSFVKKCPYCGHSNKSNANKFDTACIVVSVITCFYSMGSCLNDFFSKIYPYSAVPYVVLLFLICMILGIISIIKSKRIGKSLFGMILALCATLLAVVVNILIR